MAAAAGAGAAAAVAVAAADSVDAVALALVSAASDGYLEGPGAGDKVAHTHARASDKLARQTGDLDPSRVVPGAMKLPTAAWFLRGEPTRPLVASGTAGAGVPAAAAADPLPPAYALTPYAADEDAGDVQLVQRAYIDAARERAMYAYALKRYARAAEYSAWALCHALPPRRSGKKVKLPPKLSGEQKARLRQADDAKGSGAGTAAALPAVAGGGLPPLQAIALSGCPLDSGAALKLLPHKKFRLSLDASAQLRDVLTRSILQLTASHAAGGTAVVCPYFALPHGAAFVCAELLAPHLPRAGDEANSGPRGTTANWKLYAEGTWQLAQWYTSPAAAAAAAVVSAEAKQHACARAARAAVAHVYGCHGTDVDAWLSLARAVELLTTASDAAPVAAAARSAALVLSWLCYDRARSFIALSARPFAGRTGGHISLDPLQARLPAIDAHLLRLTIAGADPRAAVGPIVLTGRRPPKPSTSAPAAATAAGAGAKAADDDDDDDDAVAAPAAAAPAAAVVDDKHLKTGASAGGSAAAAAAARPALEVGASIPARGGGTRTLHACIPTPALVTHFGLHNGSALDALLQSGNDLTPTATTGHPGGGTWTVPLGDCVARWFGDPFEVYGLCEPNKAAGAAPRTRMSQRHAADARAAAADGGAAGAGGGGGQGKAVRTVKRTEDERDDDDAAREYDDNDFDARLL